MKHDYDDDGGLTGDSTGLRGNPFDRARQQATRDTLDDLHNDPHDDGLDDSFLDEEYDDYEEPERDTVQSGGSTEMYYEEEDGVDDLFDDEQPFAEEADEGPALTLVAGEPRTGSVAGREAGMEEDEQMPGLDTDEWPPTGAAASIAAARWQESPADEAPGDDWQDDELLDDGNDAGPPWPLGLIAVAVVALVLLMAGGYGVIQQRQATQEEIRQLRAELATAASPTDVSASRQALQDMKAENDALSREVETLTRDNRRLTDTVAGLEAQLDAQQATMARAEPDTPADPAPVTTTPAAAVPTATAPTGSWFVNFGSYGQEGIAREWAGKLNPGDGEAVLAAAEVNGKAIYRVRVVGLDDRDSAERVARELEATYDLPKLWVGKQKPLGSSGRAC